jgi:hypothetical protein
MARHFVDRGWPWAGAFLAAEALAEALQARGARLGIGLSPVGLPGIAAAVAACERAAGRPGSVMEPGELARLGELLARAGRRGEAPVAAREVDAVLARAGSVGTQGAVS